MYSSREEQSPPAEAPALGPAELKSTTNGEDARPAGLLHEPHELSTSTLAKLEAASDEVCPERDATTPICPAHRQKSCQDQSELCCPRHPRAYSFDVGFSSVGTNGTARAAAAGD